jgi:hypothetical protein
VKVDLLQFHSRERYSYDDCFPPGLGAHEREGKVLVFEIFQATSPAPGGTSYDEECMCCNQIAHRILVPGAGP